MSNNIYVLTKLFSLIFTIPLLTACFGNPAPVPQDYFYTLPDNKISTATSKAVYSSLSVDKIRATGIYNERDILYLHKTKPLSIQRYHYHHWTMPPAQLIQQQIKAYLTANHVANQVMDYSPATKTAGVIRGTLLQFEQLIDGKNYSVGVSIELDFKSATKHHVKRYVVQTPAKDSSIHASAAAFGEAVEEIMQRFVKDINN